MIGARCMAGLAMLLGSLLVPAPALAQSLTASLGSAVVDTTVTAAQLTVGSAALTSTLTLAVTGCTKSGNTSCRVYMSANLNAGSSVTNLRWSTSSSCTSSTTVESGTTPTTSGTFVYSLLSDNRTPSGSTTIYLCYSMSSLMWTTAPSRSRYDLYFTVIRQ